MRVSLDRDHQILIGNPDIDRPIAETFALIEPLCAERPENCSSITNLADHTRNDFGEALIVLDGEFVIEGHERILTYSDERAKTCMSMRK